MTKEQIERLARIMEKGFDTLADLAVETNQRLDETNQRLDETNRRLGGLEGRFDNFLSVAGGETRRLREDLDALAARVGDLEKKAS